MVLTETLACPHSRPVSEIIFENHRFYHFLIFLFISSPGPKAPGELIG